MKAIIIRGVPGTGKTAIATQLTNLLPNTEMISVDEFKKELQDKYENLGSDINTELEHEAYKLTIKELKKILKKNPDYVIVEDLIYSEAFFAMLIDFFDEHQIQDYWFRIKRKLKHLMKEENIRVRPIKNTKKDFEELKQSIDNLKIEGEFLIFNDKLEMTLEQMFAIIHHLQVSK